jgi:hypothetical protein
MVSMTFRTLSFESPPGWSDLKLHHTTTPVTTTPIRRPVINNV